MERTGSSSSYRQVRRCRVEEDADQDVNNDEDAGCAEEGFQELHSGHIPPRVLVTSGGRVACDLIEW